MRDWPKVQLDELGTVSRGRSRHRPRNDPSLYDGPYPFIQTSDVKHSGLYISAHSQTYNDVGLAQSQMWPAGTLCITIAANIADTAILSYDACFPDSIIGFIADPEKADVRFVKYYFDLVQVQYQQIAQGAAQDNLSQQKLLSFPIPAPPLNTQKQLADILSAYDNLININHRRMALLEEAMHRLYREWFVFLRFPGHERVKNVSGVPEGWMMKPMADLIAVNPPVNLERGAELPYVPMSSVSETSMDITNIESRSAQGGARFKNDDTLLARITPSLENGKTGYVQFLDGPDAVATGSTEFIVLRSEKVPPRWVYCLARSYQFRQHAINSMTGSDGRQRAQPDSFTRFLVPLPPKEILDQFDAIAEPVFRQIHILSRCNKKLSEARDGLLPRLMNGSLIV